MARNTGGVRHPFASADAKRRGITWAMVRESWDWPDRANMPAEVMEKPRCARPPVISGPRAIDAKPSPPVTGRRPSAMAGSGHSLPGDSQWSPPSGHSPPCRSPRRPICRLDPLPGPRTRPPAHISSRRPEVPSFHVPGNHLAVGGWRGGGTRRHVRWTGCPHGRHRRGRGTAGFRPGPGDPAQTGARRPPGSRTSAPARPPERAEPPTAGTPHARQSRRGPIPQGETPG